MRLSELRVIWKMNDDYKEAILKIQNGRKRLNNKNCPQPS